MQIKLILTQPIFDMLFRMICLVSFHQRNFLLQFCLGYAIYSADWLDYYAATQFRLHYGCLLSTDRRHPVPTRSRLQRFLRRRYTIRFARTEPADCPVHGSIVTCDIPLECPGHVKIGWKGIQLVLFSSRFGRFTEFRHLVECVGTKSGIIILGDFNVLYGDVDDAHTRALRDILSDANLRQNVTEATHNRGNILDVIITSTSSSPITRASVDDLVTNHYAIICHLVTTKPRPARKNITYRRYAAIDNMNFSNNLCESTLFTQRASDITGLYHQYDKELCWFKIQDSRFFSL